MKNLWAKILTLLLALSITAGFMPALTSATSSVPPQIVWQHEFMTGKGYSVYPLSDGGYVFNAANTTTNFLVKTDSSGNIVSTTPIQIDDDEAVILPYFVPTSDGGYAFAGNTSSMFVLAKVDEDGGLLWHCSFPSGAPLCFMRAMIQTNDGGFALAGFEQIADEDIGWSWFARTDSQGNLLWNKTFSDPIHDCPSNIIHEPNGDFTLSDVIFSIEPNFAYYRLVRTDPDGNIKWSQTYGDLDRYKNPECNTIIRTSDGGYHIGGWLAGGSRTAWVVKTDAQGNMQWNQTYGGRSTAVVCARQTGDADYLLAVQNLTQMWLVKTDSLGNQMWNLTFEGGILPGRLEGNYHSMVLSEDESCVVLGTKEGNVWLLKLEGKENVAPDFLQVEVAIAGVIIAVFVLVGYRVFRKKKM
ncbi:MAG: hypothetical protein NWF01_05030 [Candidatus Bathyarchaeota archaeon]|nr:hypothetical protein [Candidatus Bathyarchaeota archaeon]